MSERPCAYTSLSEQDRLAIDTSVVLTYKTSRERIMLNPAKATPVDFMRVMAMDAARRNDPPNSITHLVNADISIRREQIAKTPQLLKESREKFLMAQINQGLIPDDIANFIYQTTFMDMRTFIDPTKIRPELKSRLASAEAAASLQTQVEPDQSKETSSSQSEADAIMQNMNM